MRLSQIVVVADTIARTGAVPDAIADAWRCLVGDARWRVALLATKNDMPGLPARIVPGLPELLLDRRFLAADLLIYHFSDWNPVHDALLLGNGHARQAVFLHDIPEVERALRQVNNVRRADRIWPVGKGAAGLLARLGFDPAQVGAAAASPGFLRQEAAQLLFNGRRSRVIPSAPAIKAG